MLKSNQMKFIYQNGNMKYLDFKLIDFNEIQPIGFNLFGHNEVACAVENVCHVTSNNIKNFQIIDVREFKRHVRKTMNRWFPFKEKNTTMAVGILWTAFVQYVFPWLLDLAKVYCAFQIAQGFYKEHKGIGGEGGKSGGRTGFQTFVYYGKWLIVFHLIPVGVELLDAIGTKMMIDIKTNPIYKN